MTEPTLHEVVRRLDDVAHQITNLVTKIDSDRRRDADTYVNRESYREYQRLVEATFKAHAGDSEDLERDIKALEEVNRDGEKWRRQASFNLAVLAVGWLLTIALALFAFLTR